MAVVSVVDLFDDGTHQSPVMPSLSIGLLSAMMKVSQPSHHHSYTNKQQKE